METSLFLAKVLGIWMVVAGILLLKEGKGMVLLVQDLLKDRVSLFLSAILSLLIGALLVAGHNVWIMGWPLIITLIGWISLMKGILFTLFPETARSFSQWWINSVNLSWFGLPYILLGGWLLLIGFGLIH